MYSIGLGSFLADIENLNLLSTKLTSTLLGKPLENFRGYWLAYFWNPDPFLAVWAEGWKVIDAFCDRR
jgi:hypothetical protein